LFVQFDDASTPGDGAFSSWQWDFGDGSPGATGQNARHVFNDPGTYTVTLTVSTEHGTDSAQQQVSVSEGAGIRLRDGVYLPDSVSSVDVSSYTDSAVTLTYSGAGVLPVREGDVLVSAHDGGLLREVTAVAQTNGDVTLATGTAQLADAIASGDMDVTVDLVDSAKAVGATATSTLFDLSGAVLLNDGVVYAGIPQGSIRLTPEVQVLGSFTEAGLQSLEARTATVLNISCDVLVDADDPVNVSGDGATLLDPAPVPFVIMAGSLPLVGVAAFGVDGGYAINTASGGSLEAGFDSIADMTLGNRYENGAGSSSTALNLNPQSHTPAWSHTDSASVEITLNVFLDVSLFGSPLSEMTASPYMTFDYDAAAQPAEAELAAGIDAVVSLWSGAAGGAFSFIDPVTGPYQSIWTWTADLPQTDLAVSPLLVVLSESSPSATVTVSNAGGGVLTWEAVPGNGVQLSSSGDTANSSEVTLSASDFSSSVDTSVFFQNTARQDDAETVVVSIRGTEDPPDVALPDMVSVPAGSFPRGDPFSEGYPNERPVHEVTLSAYEIGTYEVTNADIVEVFNWALDKGFIDTVDETTVEAYGKQLLDLGDADCQIAFEGGRFVVESADTHSWADYPVLEITWFGAAVYTNWLSAAAGLQPAYDTTNWTVDLAGDGYRLPTAAEWERAAAWDDVTDTAYRYGIASNDISQDRASYEDNDPLGYGTEPFTTPVGYYNGQNGTVDSPSPVGAYDMCGNVWEWVHDWFADDYYDNPDTTDPLGPPSGVVRENRGGAWGSTPYTARASIRASAYPQDSNRFVGFRVAR
jgi:formylglycine-generating enzyme required for sulfatase activity